MIASCVPAMKLWAFKFKLCKSYEYEVNCPNSTLTEQSAMLIEYSCKYVNNFVN